MGEGFLPLTRQLERLRPHQIRDALAERSLIWLPLGTVEWHCEHLPVGLDTATAYALCLAAAGKAGGLVYPPLYYGTGGDHGAYPWTVMMPEAAEIEAMLDFTLHRLSAMEVERCMIVSGHFATEQLAMIDRIAARWNANGAPPRVTATAALRCPSLGMKPDHAGTFETVLMAAIAPETVALDRLQPLASAPDTPDRHDPKSPIWGVMGADPRLADLSEGPALFGRLVDWLVAEAGR